MSEIVQLPRDDESSSATQPRVAADSAAENPGGVLRRAREAQGLSIDDVAEILRYSPRQIEFIETDAYDRLPGATAARGFVRGYAKLLKVDPTPLLAVLDSDVPKQVTDIRAPSNIGSASDDAEADAVSLRSLGIVALIVVVLAAAIYWLTQADEGNINQTAQSETAVVVVESPATSNMPAAVAPATGTDFATSLPSESLPPSTSSAAADAQVVAAPELVLEFDELSWVEVRDASQSVILVGEFSKGARQVLTGKMPMYLWIGRASAVRASYRGAPLDLKTSSREDVARLTIE